MSQTRFRQFFINKVPASCFIGASGDDLVSRSAANYDAIQVWGQKGNTKAVTKAGYGLTALCAWRAARILTKDAQKEPFQRVSGLSPRQFDVCDKECEAAFHTAASLPITPRKNRVNAPLSPSSTSPHALQQLTPQTRLRSVINRGALGDNGTFARSPLSRGSTGQSVRFHNSEGSNKEDPETPTRRVTRCRPLPVESPLSNSRVNDTIPISAKGSLEAPLADLSSAQAKRQISEAIEDVSSSPSNHIKNAKKRKRLILEYPGGEPMRIGGIEVFGEWDSRNGKEKIDRCMAALQQAIDKEEWIAYASPGVIKISL